MKLSNLLRAKSRTLGLATLLGLVCTSAVSHATYYLPASAGQKVNTTANCFSEYYGTEQNTCSTWQYWNFPLVGDVAFKGFQFTPSIDVYAPTSANSVSCYGYSIDWTGAEVPSLYQGTTASSTTFGTVQHISPGEFLDNSGVIQMVCMVNPGGYVNNIFATYYYPEE